MQNTRTVQDEYTRDGAFMDRYRVESARLHRPPNVPAHASSDMAVILPILFLLLQEGADKFLLFALLYILM